MREINELYCAGKLADRTKIQAVGVDIASISKIARLINAGDGDLSLVFSDREQSYCQSRSNYLIYYALCFGVKEAVSKAFGTGLVGIDWQEIEADLNKEFVSVNLYGKAKTQAQRLCIQKWWVDWWQWRDSVLVNVLGFSEEQMNE